MSGVLLSGLHIYPVKSARGTSLTEAVAERRGLRHDRRWMLVGQDGAFLTQRTEPRLATLGVTVHEDGGLTLSAEGIGPITVAPPPPGATRMPANIWSDVVDAQVADGVANAWISRWLGQSAWLVRMPDDAPRPAALAPEVDVSFADGYPFLLCSQASLDDLDSRMDDVLPMDRFRPNLVIDGAAPWVEESWRRVRIGGVEFECVKPCQRCVVITTDQVSGDRRGSGPLRTLAERQDGPDGGAFFGMNLVVRSTGRLALGDLVEPLA